MTTKIPVGTVVWKKVLSYTPGEKHCYLRDCHHCEMRGRKLPDGTYMYPTGTSEVIVKLEVLEGGFIPYSGNPTRKGRVASAKVLEITTLEGAPFEGNCFSSHDNNFKYVVGSIVKPVRDFNADPEVICTSGIHVFENREQAVNYELC